MKKLVLAVLLLAGISFAQNEAYLLQVGGTTTVAAVTQDGSNNLITGHGTSQVQDLLGVWQDAASQIASSGSNSFYAHQTNAASFHRMETDQIGGENYFTARQINTFRDILDNTQTAAGLNYVYSDQIGSGGINRVNNWQTSLLGDNRLIVDQYHGAAGARNFAGVVQDAGGNNLADLTQYGFANRVINATATGNAYNPSDATYGGYGDGATMSAGLYNQLIVIQTGGRNTAGVNMSAAGYNAAEIWQDGLSEFEASAVQSGANNLLHIHQLNAGDKTADVVQTGIGSNNAVIWQQ